MKRILLNRFVLVPGAIALVALIWNLYVATHNHGAVVGRVIDAAGKPVVDATVALWTYNFTTYEERDHVKTDADGVFRFTSNPSHRIQVSAEKPGVGRASRVPVFLYFRAQDVDLAQPLRLTSG
jgi:Carboxypeptidase regulatory-like domain